MNENAASNIDREPDTNITPTPVVLVSTPGWQTSEFWMTALGHVGLVLAAAEGALPAKYAAIAAALSQLAYNLSRGLSKANTTR